MKKIIFTLLALILTGCGCPYTEKELPIPEIFKNSMLLTERDEYLVTGNDPDCCTSPSKILRVLREINNEVVDQTTIANPEIGRAYFERQGRKIEPLPKGKRFTILRIIAQTKDNITTAVSASDPIYYLILVDDQGILYKIATSSLGINTDELYMAYYVNGIRQGFLDLTVNKYLDKK